MKQAVLLIDCYLYGTIAILAVVLLVLVYLHGQANHLPNPFARKNIVYRPAPKARGVLLGKKYGLLAYSPEPDEGHIIVMGPSGTGKTSALLIPTLRSWQGTALVVDISGDISANVGMPNKIIFDPTAKDCVPYDVFASIDAAPDESERQERLEQLAYLLLPDKANDSEAGIFFAKNGRKMITAALICYYGMGWGFVEICEHFLYEPSISPATLETNSVYIYIPDEKLKIYGDLLRIITAQSMEYFSSRPKEHTQMILFCLDEFASFGKLQITEALRKLRKRHIRIMVLTQSLADLDMIYGKDERKAMLGNFKFTVLLGCKDTETQEYFSKMIGEKRSPLETDSSAKPQPIIKPADLAHLEQDLFVICDDGAIRLRKNFYFQ